MTMQKMEATSRMVDMHAVQHGYSILCLDAENAYFHAEDDEEVYCWPPKEWVERYHARGGRVEHPCLKLKGQLYGRRSVAKFDEFVVATTGGLGTEHCPEQPSLFRRPGTTLTIRVSPRRFLRVGKPCGPDMAAGESWCEAQAQAR